MTTHHVEIRPATSDIPEGIDPDWRPLTKTPMTAELAVHLCAQIGPLWASRIVPLARSSFQTQIDALVMTVGERHHQDRHADGTLPLTEIMALARGALFAPFEGAAEARRWRKAEVVHHPDCSRSVEPLWSVADCERISGDQWVRQQAMLKSLTRVMLRSAQIGLTVTPHLGPPRAHGAKCVRCGGIGMGVSVHVTIDWGDLVLTREYTL